MLYIYLATYSTHYRNIFNVKRNSWLTGIDLTFSGLQAAAYPTELRLHSLINMSIGYQNCKSGNLSVLGPEADMTRTEDATAVPSGPSGPEEIGQYPTQNRDVTEGSDLSDSESVVGRAQRSHSSV